MKTRARPPAFLLGLSLFALTFAAPAATNYWIGGNGNYTNTANWSLGVVPGKTDVVMFTNNATYTVTVTSSIDPIFNNTAGNLTINGDLTAAGEPLSIVAAQNIVGTGASTTISSTGGNVTLVAGATFGTLDVQPGGTFNLTGTGTMLSVTGATTSGGNINLTAGSASLGTLDISTGGSFSSSGTISISTPSLNNSGTIHSSGGSTAVTGAGGITNFGGVNISGGSFSSSGLVGNGGTLTLTGGTFSANGGINSPGSFTFAGTGTLISTGPSTFSGPLNFQSGNATFTRDTIIQRAGEDIALGPAVPTEMLLLSLSATQVTTSFFDTGGTKTTFVGRTNLNAGPASFLMSGAQNYPYFSGYLCIGAGGGANSLVVTNGAKPAIASFTTLGLTATSPNNLLRVSGTGTRLDIVAGGLEIGRGSAGNTVIVEKGGFLATAGTALIGSPYAGPTANNSVTVDGANSKWTNQNTIVVGAGAGTNNNLNVSNGGAVRAPTIAIGSQFGAFNSGVTVAVGDATLDGTMDIVVGGSGSGSSVRVFEGGRVTAGNSIVVGQNGGSSNNLVEVDGGTLTVTNASTNAVLNVRRGAFVMNGGTVKVDTLLVTNGNQSSLALNRGTLLVNSLVITNGAPLKLGDGTNGFRFSYADCFVQSPASVPLTIDHGATMESVSLSFSRIEISYQGQGDGTLLNGGWLNPGKSPGAIVLTGHFVQTNSGSILMEIGGATPATQHDFISVSGSAQFGGSLLIALINSFVPVSTNSFTLMTFASTTGAFTNIASGTRLKTVDSLGSFLVTLNSTSLVASAYQTLDADGDGIEDAWALQYFSHTPLTTAEKSADADGDGASNYNEFIAGTNPVEAGSVFEVTPSITTDGELVLRFACVAGKTYRVFYGNVIPAAFTEVVSPLFTFPSPGVCEWRDDGTGTGGELALQRRFYRVGVQ